MEIAEITTPADTRPTPAHIFEQTGPADTFDALDVLLVFARRRNLIALTTLISLAAGIILCFALKPNFTAKSVILPPQQQSSSAALLGQLAPLASFTGGASAFGLKTPADMYVGILESRTITDRLIARFALEQVYHRHTLQDTRQALKNHAAINIAKTGFIEIAITDHDPHRASDIANGYVDELYNINAHLITTEAGQRRGFFDHQLVEEKAALASAEDDLRTTQQKTGIIQLSGQAQAIIQSIAQLRAQIAGSQVQLNATRSFATEQNPEVIRLQTEIATMQGQLQKLENDQQKQPSTGDVLGPAGNVPTDALEYARKLREVKYHESLLDLLSRQYEAARIDEAKAAPVIQVIDRATIPDKRSGPPRLLIVIGLTVIGWLIGSVIALGEYAIQRAQHAPHQAVKLQAIRSAFLPHRLHRPSRP